VSVLHRPSTGRAAETAAGETSLSAGVRWSGLSVVGREVARTGFTIALARLVGPEAFGIVAQAVVYIGIVGLLLDQGFSSALIQRPRVEPDMPGAVVSVNLAVGGALMLLTVAVASAWADFMSTPELTLVLTLLAPTLLLRAASVTPRAMLMRKMRFRTIGIADVTAAMAGGALGVGAAVLGASYWALVVQILTTDVVLLLMLLLARAGVRPNMRLSRVRDIAAFSWRAFAAGLLINSVSRNIDNLLVGKFQGPTALAYYGLAYRSLLLPVQLLSVTIGGVLFPVFSRLGHDVAAVRFELTRATRSLAWLALPPMALVAAAAPQLVGVVFGADWKPAVPIVQVLALAGAAQAIYQPTTAPLVLGLGHAALNLRYALLTTAVTTAGIVAGVPFGPLGVAVGYASATAALIPVEWIIRRHLLELPLRDQARGLLAPAHVAFWVAVTYTLLAAGIPGPDVVVLVLGAALALAAGLGLMRVLYRSQLTELVQLANRVLGRTTGKHVVVDGAEAAL
jgi:O-antigen/teichoic acid export membrane protein